MRCRRASPWRTQAARHKPRFAGKLCSIDLCCCCALVGSCPRPGLQCHYLHSIVLAMAPCAQLAAAITACWRAAQGTIHSSQPWSQWLTDVSRLAAGQWGGCWRRRRRRCRCRAGQLGPAARVAGAHGAPRRRAAAAHAGPGALRQGLHRHSSGLCDRTHSRRGLSAVLHWLCTSFPPWIVVLCVDSRVGQMVRSNVCKQAVQGMALGSASCQPSQAMAATTSESTAVSPSSHPRDFWEADPRNSCASARSAMAAVARAVARRQVLLPACCIRFWNYPQGGKCTLHCHLEATCYGTVGICF